MNKETEKDFAAFIMTFERPDVLIKTIESLRNQTYPPKKILIVDNSISDNTEALFIGKKLGEDLEYLKVGYNSGPAGAAKIGLETLAGEGYQWIFWGDDDDPPIIDKSFEMLFETLKEYPNKCGQLGAVGHKFNQTKGVVERIPNEILRQNKYLEVDNIAGGVCKIVSGEAIKSGVLPETKLFFGFEELDFDLKMKAAGYKSIVNTSLFLQYREHSGRINYTRKAGIKIKNRALWREYYSTRNLISITKSNKYYSASIAIAIRKIAKSIASLKYGDLRYSFKLTKIVSDGLIDGFFTKLGRREF
ncbi:glycosyltransferase [Pontibacter oryzae]|uniref:Glycosyltransferase n=1 Tax=Pontibacter oryzae TaxID=2304593 RepID=A0A399SIH1_9BACT|nr:glycosyltransferase [Pontibacter oryzae]RIJ42774.1 glycosyltransferase [Pontibacter oryzae]